MIRTCLLCFRPLDLAWYSRNRRLFFSRLRLIVLVSWFVSEKVFLPTLGAGYSPLAKSVKGVNKRNMKAITEVDEEGNANAGNWGCTPTSLDTFFVGMAWRRFGKGQWPLSARSLRVLPGRLFWSENLDGDSIAEKEDVTAATSGSFILWVMSHI